MARNFVRTSSQYLSNANAVVSAAPCTLACWLNTTELTNTKVWMSVEDAALSHKFLLFSTGADTILAGTGGTEGFSSAGSTGTFSSGVWAHAGGVFATASSRVAYLDGVAGTANTATRTPVSLSQTLIGGEVSASFADGDLAEVAIWAAALDAAEMAALAKGASPLMIRSASLAAYWPLIGKTSPEIDLVGGFNMTLNAAPVVAAHPRVYMPQGKPYMPGKAAVAAAGTVIPSYMSGGMRELSGGMRG